MFEALPNVQHLMIGTSTDMAIDDVKLFNCRPKLPGKSVYLYLLCIFILFIETFLLKKKSCRFRKPDTLAVIVFTNTAKWYVQIT